MGYISIPTDLTGYSKIEGDNYAGNNAVNRAIAHNLTVTPKIVIIVKDDAAYSYRLMTSGSIHYLSTAGQALYAVTAMDNTNFYVGNASSQNGAANENGHTWYWVAFV